MKRLNKKDIERFCEDNFLGEGMPEALKSITEYFDEVYAEVDVKGEKAELNIKAKLKGQ